MSLSCLGSPELRHGDSDVVLPTRKSLALLIYLAVEGGQHTREKLAALFWPDSDDEHARAALRRALAFLREGLRAGAGERASGGAGEDGRGDAGTRGRGAAGAPPRGRPGAGERGSGGAGDAGTRGYGGVDQADHAHLLSQRDILSFSSGPQAEVDVHLVAAAWSAARGTAGRPSFELVPLLRAASTTARGEFLEGFSLGDAPVFDDWASAQRELWHRRLGVVFDRLSQLQSEGGDPAGALETTARWIARDPLNEAAHRRQIQLHLAEGDRAAALRAYKACRAILERELYAEPAPETEALAARVRAEPPRLSQARPGEVEIPLVTVEPPLVGRMDEHARLVAAYRAASRGRPKVVAIEGESGIGKTRLAREFLRWAAAQGACVLQGGALEAGRRLPYQPLAEALRSGLAGERPGHLLGPVWLAPLAALLPELAEELPSPPSPEQPDQAKARARLSEAVARLGLALAERAPVILFCDDFQWADADSLDLLQYAVRRWAAAGARMVVLLSVRAEDLSAEPSPREWLSSLGRELPVTHLSLGPLALADTLRLVDGLGSPSFGNWLHAETSGHPLFLSETVKALFERGVLVDEPGAGQLRLADLPDGRWEAWRGFLAPGVREVIRARLSRLGPTARTLAAAASVLGSCSFEHLCRVAGVPEEEALPALDELLARRVLRESGSHLLFAHDKLREVAYADAGEARRRFLHRRSLAVLESAGLPAAELARHALAAGLSEEAVRLSIAAGDEAMRVYALRDAIAYYEQALLRSPAPVSLPSSFYAQLGRARELLADYPRAEESYRAMLAAARASRQPREECAALNRLALLAAHVSLELDSAAELLRSARAVAEAAGDQDGLAETEWNLGQVEMYGGRLESALAVGERALALARALERPEGVARALSQLAYTRMFLGHFEQAAALAREARELYALLGNHALEADARSLEGQSLVQAGRAREGLAVLREARTISARIENLWGQANSAFMSALGLLDVGDYQEGLELARSGAAWARELGYGPLRVFTLGMLGRLHRELFNLEAARAAHQEMDRVAIEECSALGNSVFPELAAGELCADAAAAGDWEAAHLYARRTLEARSSSVVYVASTYSSMVEALWRGGEPEAAARELRWFEGRIGDNRRFQVVLLRASARLARLAGDSGRAANCLQRALDLAHELGLPVEQWQIQAELGEVLLERGDHVRAAGVLASAAQIVRALAERIEDEELRTRLLSAERVRRLERQAAQPAG